jgi:hypothetical protein
MGALRSLAAAALALAACSSDGGGGSPGDAGLDAEPDAGELGALVAALEDDGFVVQRGAFVPEDLADCCDPGRSCFGNNPASPYAGFRVPPGPGQEASNPRHDENDESIVYRLREDEAIVYVGRTPPASGYFGYTPYLFDRDDGSGNRVEVFASLSETLNHLTIAVDGAPADWPFDRRVAVVAAADEGVAERVRAALLAASFPEAAINFAVFDPTVARFGLEDEADTFTVIFRVAFFEDESAGAAFLAEPPGDVLRLTPESPGDDRPFDAPAARPKDTSATEAALSAAVDDLEAALVAEYATAAAESLAVTNLTADPALCIDALAACYGDNRDTIYPATGTSVLFDTGDEFYVVYGVDHEATGKATYASATVHGLIHFVGVATATSREYGGSAGDEVPGHPDAARLYAWKFARDCGADPHCTVVLDEGCPSGVADGALGLIMFRTYLEPSTRTAPEPGTLVTDRVLRFTP